MDRRSAWTCGSILAFGGACALMVLELRSTRPLPPSAERPQASLPAPKAPPSAFPAPTPGLTNDSLTARLQDETAKMGIQAIGAQDEEPEAPEPFLRPGEPGSREQAEAAIRQIALMRKAVDRRAGKRDAVSIEGRVAPVLAQDEDSGGSPLSGAAADRWSGAYADAEGGTRTIEDDGEWAKVWRSFSDQPVPTVDFSRSEAVCVFLGERPTGGYSTEIVGVRTAEDSVLVQYVERSPDPAKPAPDGATAPYAIRLIPRSDLPVRYQKLR